MSQAVQLTGSEVTVVYLDPDTKRILGFGPPGMKPMFPAGTRYSTETLYHARDVERKCQQYREQCLQDAEIRTLCQFEAEAPFRRALREEILARNAQLAHEQHGQYNIDLNNALLNVMDTYYAQAMEGRRKVLAHMVSEAYEASKKSTDIALDSPYLKARNA